MKVKNAVVTGGMGFIGSHLVEALIAQGTAVTVIDNLSTGRRSNLQSVLKNPLLKIIEQDIANSVELAPSIRDADCVFHLAALADLIPSIEKPMDYVHSNVAGTAGILEAARKAGVRRFVNVASSSCYGLAGEIPTTESAPVCPEHPYALTKYLAEQMVMHWAKVYQLSAVSLRFFNVYGPRVRTNGAYGAVFGVFLAQKLRGRPLTIVGDGSQTRDFTFVTDVVRALTLAAESGVENEIFNVGSGHTYAVSYLAELIGGEKIYLPKRPGEPDCTFADISKIKNAIGWQPEISLEEGVRRMMSRIEDWKDAPVWTPERIEEATRCWFQHLSPELQVAGETNVRL